MAEQDGATARKVGFERERVTRLEAQMLQYAFKKPELEPVMLSLSRTLGLTRVEREILKVREIVNRRTDALQRQLAHDLRSRE